MTLTPLDRESSVSLWAQLEIELRRRLEGGEFDQGFFPTDLELTDAYGVSRHTVREALRHLTTAGVLQRVRGRGTVVNRGEFEQTLGTLYSLFESIESAGVSQTSEVRRLEVTTDVTAASRLELDARAELVVLERLRFAGDTPLAIDTAWLPRDVAGALLDVDWSHTALYSELAKAGAPVPNQGWEQLTPIVPTEADRVSLGLAPTDAAFFLERLGCRDDKPMEWRTTVVRGDRYRFVANWSAGQRTELRPTAA